MPSLPVMFRVDPTHSLLSGAPEVTAIFPTLPHDSAGRYLTCYAHVGQHGGASEEWINGTRPAAPAEYADLLAELRLIYEPDETLRVVKRRSPTMRAAFNLSLRSDG